MKSFIKDKISSICEHNSQDLRNKTIIIPNKRAAVYIHKAFAEILGKPIFLPQVLTINEWVDSLLDDKIITSTELLFTAYEAHIQIEQSNAESIDDYLKWGKIMINDFDEIDRYLLDVDQVFKNLKDIKEIEDWSFGEEELSKGQEKFLSFWEKLPRYYTVIREILARRNELYQGQAFRLVYQKLSEGQFDFTNQHFYFLGFNALSKSEEGIIKKLMQANLATVFWDVDEFYVANKEHEAGHFFRKIANNWAIPVKAPKQIDAYPKKISIIETAQDVGQAKIAGEIIEKLISSGQNLDSTAIVLADESMLIPLTRSLPPELGTVNITMGYPIKYSHLQSLIDAIFGLQLDLVKFGSERIYHKNVLSILNHSFIRSLMDDRKSITAFEHNIIKGNLVFVELDELFVNVPDLKKIDLIFKAWDTPSSDCFAAIHQLVNVLYNNFKTQGQTRDLDLEILYHFSKGVKRFESFQSPFLKDLALKSFKKLFYQFWQNESLSFVGNPIEGIQIMGILETRTLDFDNIIFLGMNEGNLPTRNHMTSFIPFDLKKMLELPLEEDREAIFAHHFYRLFHRSKHIWITYNSAGEGVSYSEKSRYIIQLENELNKEHEISKKVFVSEDSSAKISTTSYPSSTAVQERLDQRFSNGEKGGLSPSAFNKLVQCPLDFFYRYVLEMKEDQSVEEQIESSTFGTKIHEVLEFLIRKNFEKEDGFAPLDAATLQGEIKNISSYLEKEYLKTFKRSEIKYGQNKLSFDVSVGFIESFIQNQIKEIKREKEPIIITELEENLSATYDWEINGKRRKIVISGLADRIDRIGDHYRIIDYKSGKCDQNKTELKSNILNQDEMHKFIHHADKGYARQLLMYALMFRQQFPERKNFSVGIISMININNWINNVQIKGRDIRLTNDLLDKFEEELKFAIEGIYQKDFRFEHNPKANYCEHCEN